MADADRAPAAPRRPDWRRMGDGLFLIGLGVFLLLNASGRLSWTFWYDAVTLWPILIVSAGLRIAVDQTRVAWLALLGPMLVLATLAVVAGGRLDNAPGPWQPVSVARAEGVRQLALHAALASTRIDVTARPLDGGLLVDGRQGSRTGKAHIETKQEGGQAHATLFVGSNAWESIRPGRLSRWELGVQNAVPLKIDIDGAMIGARFDLTRGRVEGGTFDGAFLGLDLHLPSPDEPVRLEIHGAFNMIDLFVPEGTPVRVLGPGFPFNLVERGTGDPKNVATPGYDVRFAGVFSRIGVNQEAAR
jgi:hypothetical protein